MFWKERFPSRTPNPFVFPFERYGGKGKDEVFGFSGSVAYDTSPNKPVGDWKEGWEAAKKRAGVTCRFHDLRHTGCTRLLEAGVPFSVVSEIMGGARVRVSAWRNAMGTSDIQPAVKLWTSWRVLAFLMLRGTEMGTIAQRRNGAGSISL